MSLLKKKFFLLYCCVLNLAFFTRASNIASGYNILRTKSQESQWIVLLNYWDSVWDTTVLRIIYLYNRVTINIHLFRESICKANGYRVIWKKEDKKEDGNFDANMHKITIRNGWKQERKTKCKSKSVRSERRKEEWRHLREESSTSA